MKSNLPISLFLNKATASFVNYLNFFWGLGRCLGVKAIFLFMFSSVCFAESHPVVTKVIASDVIVLNDGREVSLIGVDCPKFENPNTVLNQAESLGVEPDWYAEQAERGLDFVDRLLTGKQVKTEVDPANEFMQHRNGSGQFLAYVYLVEDNSLINRTVIQQGYCGVLRSPAFHFRDNFLENEKNAKMNRVGLWR